MAIAHVGDHSLILYQRLRSQDGTREVCDCRRNMSEIHYPSPNRSRAKAAKELCRIRLQRRMGPNVLRGMESVLSRSIRLA